MLDDEALGNANWIEHLSKLMDLYQTTKEFIKFSNEGESLNSNSQERELHQLQQMQDKAKESCMASFRLLHPVLQVLSNNDIKRPGSEGGFERAFASLFDQDVQTFRDSMLQNLNQLQKQLDKDVFQEDRSMAAF
ncbi:hypothetical protein Tco_0687519 [Tanacetum coccineum]